MTLLFTYIGYEQGSWGDISFRKESHYYVMPGILYLAEMVKQDSRIAAFVTPRCRYYNRTVQSREEIAESIMREQPAAVGFSCYCWNISDVLAIAADLRARLPHIKILLGGPEISMTTLDECRFWLADKPFVNCLVSGPAETRICPVVEQLAQKEPNSPPLIFPETAADSVTDLSFIPSPYPFAIDVARSAACGLGMVYETTRGCPYRCIYCQFGHKNHKPAHMALDRVEKELTWLLEFSFDCIHFADAVFDLDPAYAKSVLDIIALRNRRSSIFTYCSFARLDAELACKFEETQCQIAVGIQSTNPRVLAAIHRSLSPKLFEEKKEILAKHHLNFYTDLIFGLPEDSLESFRRTFNQTVVLDPAFLMLFPLSLIKGTPLEISADSYGVKRYSSADVSGLSLLCDIRYDNIALHRNFNPGDLEQFDDVALACFYFYSRFGYSIRHIRTRAGDDVFSLFQRIGKRTKQFLTRMGRRATNTDFIEGFKDEIALILTDQLNILGAGEIEIDAFKELFKLDIYRILLLIAPQREKVFLQTQKFAQGSWDRTMDDLRIVKTTWGKFITLSFELDDLLRLDRVRESARKKACLTYLHAPYHRWDSCIFKARENDKAAIELIPADRPVRAKALRGIAEKEGISLEEMLKGYAEMGILKPVVSEAK
jgi:radical SAM superfamily enzyme YgiQ (UPF0313 family)